ncbi:GNAT family N-acetyltransferase, partial [Pseudoalteromonas piscicida]
QDVGGVAVTYPHLQGLAVGAPVLDELDLAARFTPKQIEHIPREGPVVMVANHPLGSLDALALIKVLAQVRTDLKVV